MQKVSAPKLENEQRSQLIADYYFDDIKLTEQLINRDLSVWYK